MATPHSALASPTTGSAHLLHSYQPSNGDFSSLDFLSLIGLDSGTPVADVGSPQMLPPSLQQAEAGTSKLSHSAGSPSARRDSSTEDRSGGRGRGRGRSLPSRGGKSRAARSEPMIRDHSMDVDQPLQVQLPYGSGQDGQDRLDAIIGMGGYGMLEGDGFDTVQAGFLQQQLEHIHMQSPLMYDPSNVQSSYHPMAQMYLTSPPGQASQAHRQDGQSGTQLQQYGSGSADDSGDHRVWHSKNGMGGVMTPAPSGDIYPQDRTELMSPMQLEMLNRGENIEGHSDFNIIPLLSPALSHQAGGSAFTSPANQMAFTSKSNHHSTASSHFNLQAPQTLSPIEQLQEQQRQFQEQLILLQHQQRQLQATAALVAAASTSPYTGGSGSGFGPMRPVSTPGVYGSHSAGSVGTTPPGCFSPLTSPALDASARATHYNRQHGNSPAFASHHQHTPHPLSAISSPALNPVGSSGGAQQTLSPALQPQNNAEVADPEYIRALVGFLDGQQTHIGGQFQHVYQSPITSSAQQLSSPLAGAEGSTGPHRNSLPVKSRPSPMMKPTNHRAHARHSSSSTLPDQFSVPSSPIAQKYYPSVPGMGYLPPAAFDQRSVQQQQQAMHSSASNSSTPSPVDLSQMMPPPPIPPYNSVSKSMTPLTPASLMNLGHTSGNGDTNKRQLAALPKRQVATRKAVAAAASVPAAKKAGNGTKIVPSSIGKRALAIRPPGNIGVRTANKAVAAATPLVLPEGETRRTSHKAAEQKRRDSLKAGFDELRLLLPPINTEALDPESGEPIPGSSAPRLLPKSSLVPDDNPNRGVSKVALLKFSNEHIVRLHDKVEKRDGYIDKLRDEVRRLRDGADDEVRGEEGEDLLDLDMLEGEEEDFGDPVPKFMDGHDPEDQEDDEDEMDGVEDMEDGDGVEDMGVMGTRSRKARNTSGHVGSGRRPGLEGKSPSSGMTVSSKSGRRGE